LNEYLLLIKVFKNLFQSSKRNTFALNMCSNHKQKWHEERGEIMGESLSKKVYK
jgi:hypothetical protein